MQDRDSQSRAFIERMREEIHGIAARDPLKIVSALALESTLELDTAVTINDERARRLFHEISLTGVITVEGLMGRMKEPEDWIAFSRLQRARLLEDIGTEFTLSARGYDLLKRYPVESAPQESR